MKLLATVLITFAFFSTYGQSSNYTLSGSIVDKDAEPIVVGDVIIYKGDSMNYHATVIDGSYTVSDIKADTYLVKVKSLGYKEAIQEIDIKENITLDFVLEEDAALLSEVTVVAMRESINYENGNVKVNMTNSIFSQQPSTLDALGMMPGVISDPIDQTISIIGAGSPLLYIGNRNITMDELLAIPVSNIKEVEIVFNPSAKYEASGASVVLITLYKNLEDGIQVELTENAVKRRRFNNYAGINTSLRLNKWEVKSNFGFNSLMTWEGVDSRIDIPDEPLTTDYSVVSVGDRPQYVGGAGVFYQINEEDYISVNGNLRKHTTDGPIESTSTTNLATTVNSVETIAEEKENRGFYTANINYNNGFKASGSNLFMGVQASRYNRGLQSDVFNNFNNSSLILDQNREQDYEIDVLAARVDFEQKLKGGQTIEAGVNVYSGVAEAFQQFDFQQSSSSVQSFYDYEESNIALYGQLIGSAYGIQYTAGLRSESTDFYGKFQDQAEPTIDRRRTNFFPRLNLSYQIDSTSSINFNFSSVIRRPNYLNATSIATYITPYLEYQRNANLVPSTARFLSINYQKGRQSVNVTAYTRDNLVQQSVRYDDITNRIINGPENFDLERGLNLRVSNFFAYKKWTINTVVMGSINQLKDSSGVSQDVTPFLYFYANNRFALPYDISLGVNAFGLTGRDSGLFKRNGRLSVGTSITKSIGDLTISLNANDIFRGMNFREEYTINNIYSNTLRYGDMKSISLSLRYRFGKTFKSKYQNRDVDENLDRMG